MVAHKRAMRTAHRDLAPGVLAGMLIALAASYALVPSLREPLTREDGVTEWVTAAFFLTAGSLGLSALKGNRSPWFWLIPVAGFIGFGEETAYGARIFGFPLPTVDGQPVDGLHDVFDLGDRLLDTLGIGRTEAAAIVLVALTVAALAAHRRGRLSRIRPWLQERPAVGFVMASLFASVMAVGLDLTGTTMLVRFAEELLELAAAGILIVGTTHLRTQTSESESVKEWAR